jgi:hypothetical protein
VARLTRTALFNLLCRDGQDTKNLNHDTHDCFRHSRGRGDLFIGLQTSEDVFYAREEVKEWSSTSANIINSLRYLYVTKPRKTINVDTHRKKDSNSRKNHPRRWVCLQNKYQKADRGLITSIFVRLTKLTPGPMVAENALMTLTVGISHAVNLSPLL